MTSYLCENEAQNPQNGDFYLAQIVLIVNGGRNGSEHDGKDRGPTIQTCHVVLGSCVNADSHLKFYISGHQYRIQ